jgi:hypothetical protein
MVTRRTAWPYLQRLYSDKQHEHYDAERAYRESVYRGDPDDSKARWLTALQVELDELSEALTILTGRSSRVEFGGAPLMVSVVLIGVLMIAQLMLLIWLAGGNGH